MNQRDRLLGSAAGTWCERRPHDSLLGRLMASHAAREFVMAENEALVKGDTISVPLQELQEAGGDILRCPSIYNQAGGAEQARE